MIAELFRDLPEAQTPYGSHLPTLGKALDLLPRGAVLELGMGDTSTRQLHEACGMQGRFLASYDHDPIWASKFVPYRATWHVVEAVRDYGDVPVYERLWAVALVDHAPMPRRVEEIRRLKDQAMLLVVHDSEPRRKRERASYWYGHVFPLFRYRWDDRSATLPWTTVVSNYHDVGRLWAAP